MIRLEPFEPNPVVDKAQDPLTRQVWPPRKSTTDEQGQEAIAACLDAMAEADDWVAEVEVRWTRHEPTVLHVEGHAEHLTTERGRRTIGVMDLWWEQTLDGTQIGLTPSERFRRLESELEDAWDVGLDSQG